MSNPAERPDASGPMDERYRYLPGTDTPFDPPMPTYGSLEAWESRKAELRAHILVCAGLVPTPPRTPLNAQTLGRHEADGYVVENIAFESRPGFYVTGNLYAPLRPDGPCPGIASPHGHAARGRFNQDDVISVPARGVTLARMGHVVFAYDMVGYNDSMQVEHRFKGRRERLWGLSPLGLQLWNSIRVLDFLESRDEVDPDRLGCTGASGGGTQTFLLTAVDDRVKVSVPVNMISAHMQGGCVCENAPGLRLDTTNVEIAAMTAPRPMLLVSATGDWTKDTPTVEYPAIRDVYRLYDAEDRIKEVQFDAEHNYNAQSRSAMYPWINRWLQPGRELPGADESLGELPSTEALSAFPGGLPDGALSGPDMIDALIEETRARRDQAASAETAPAYRHVVNVRAPRQVDAETVGPEGDAERLILRRDGSEEFVPALHIAGSRAGASTVVVVHPDGKAACLAQEALVSELRADGHGILAIDAFRTGETARLERAEDVHFHTFNRSDLASRIQDIVTAAAYVAGLGGEVDLVGVGQAGLWVLLARPSIPRARVTVAGLGEIDAASDGTFESDLYLPGMRLFGDVTGAAALTSPGVLRVHGASQAGDWGRVRRAYDDAGSAGNVSVEVDPAETGRVVGWLR